MNWISKCIRQMAFPVWILLLLISVQSWAQNVTASVDRTKVGLNERFEVTYSINGSGEFEYPSFTNFKQLSGPNQSSQTSIVNGSVSQKKSISYTLRPKKLGTFTLPAITATVGGKKVKSNTVKVNVVKGSPKAEANNVDLKNDVFVRALVTKTNPYIGEQFIVTYKLYFNRRVSNPQLSEAPKFSGFWSQDLLKGKNNRGTQEETYKGKQYDTYVLAQYMLIPQKFGKLKIEPMVLDINIQVPTKRRDFWGQMVAKTIETTIRSHERTLDVKALPKKGRPVNFSGAVGQFSLSNNLSEDSIEVNNTITFTQTLKGKGNLKLFSLPNVGFPKDIEAYEPKSNDKISVNGGGMRGQKENQYILVPRNKGMYKFTIDGFNYFDPEQKKYVSVGEQIIEINVSGNGSGHSSSINNENFGQNNPIVQKEEVGLLDGGDILFISENTSFSTPTVPFFGTAKYWMFWILPFVVGGIVVAYVRSQAGKVVDQVALKNKRAKSVAKKRLKEAAKHLNGTNDTLFYQTLLSSVSGYLKDKMNIQSADLNTDYILTLLSERNVPEDLQNEFKSIIDTCQMANYGGFDSSNKQELYKEAERVIEKMEDAL